MFGLRRVARKGQRAFSFHRCLNQGVSYRNLRVLPGSTFRNFPQAAYKPGMRTGSPPLDGAARRLNLAGRSCDRPSLFIRPPTGIQRSVFASCGRNKA